MKVGLFLFLCPILHVMKDALASQCWQAATFSESIISPDLKSSSILRVPKALSLAQCAGACCELPGCDLAWLFERRCYVLSCRRQDDCAPKQRHGADSYLAFLQRRPPQTLVLQSLVRAGAGAEPFPAGRWHQLPARPHALQDSLKDLALLQGERGFEGPELEYPDSYRGVEEEELDRDVNVDADTDSLNEGLVGLLDWPDIQGSREALNLSDIEDGKEELQSTPPDPQGSSSSLVQPSASSVMSNGSGPSPSDTQPTLRPSVSAPADLNVSVSGVEHLSNISSTNTEPTALSQNFSAYLVQLSSQTRTSSPTRNLLTASSTTPQTTPVEPVRTLLVSIEGPVEITLPINTVELRGSVSPAPQPESSYSYRWSWVSLPEGHKEEMEGEYSKRVKISGLSAGQYAVKVTVSGEHLYGESVVNITVHSEDVNNSPKAIVYPPAQHLTFPVDLVIINGSESTDDGRDIVTYHWEQVAGPLLANGSSAETPILLLHNLEPGQYTFKLTVTDAQGLADSATASVSVASQPQDRPPVASAGPDEVITLPLDHLILRGNQSSDDQGVISYLWALHPSSQSRVVTMQGVQEPFLQLSGLQEGRYTFQLTVTDSSGQEDSSTATVTVLPENTAPVAVAGPDRQLILPVNSVTLDGSSSTDDQGIASFHWDTVSGPPGSKIRDANKAVTMATGLRAGSHKFLLTVKDQQGATDTAAFTVTVKEVRSLPLVAHASGSHTLTLPNNSLVLCGSVSNAGPVNVSFLWVRDEQSPAAGDILYGSERMSSLYLANLVEGTYLFQLRVSDALGRSSSATATVEVRPDPREREEVELELQVGVAQVSQQQRSTVLRQLAALLHVLDADIALKGLHGQSDISTVMRFSVQGSDGTIPGPQLAKMLRNQLLREKTDFLLFKVLRVDTVMCLLHCSGRGQCDPISKACACDPLWMENPFQRLLEDGESNCEWNVLYVVLSLFLGFVLILSVSWTCFCCCKRSRRTKVRKKTKYTILDNMDEQERMELRPKYHIKHRSTEHNSSLMMSESEFDSEQDTIFSHERSDRPRNRSNGATRNGDAFSFRPVDG
ncbi:dyslexia-associated protein KIAA0319 isoform X1 [Alosa sapidissima]|uniref:dyslexia-associated protein KIAA0319 isoform X1 n=1 Tax=Alosa sapidissima TaxID=34773 RepID=UPI001C081FE1|nr:dyslexia-associated protein KIAA0319 isoform X1 [Alosa sapidissima]XP_041961681.1 dyslexia-associated protein KIAA0319 isoform X1 [Alosa sapidissima]XP_041961682.1 dyslexia-associated protein KIAA0319 isoform X1 [Alosa sapidissima]